MKYSILIWTLFFSISGEGQGKIQTLRKLTSEGVLEIQIDSSKTLKSNESDPSKSISAIRVARKLKSIDKSRWPKLAKKEALKIVVLGDSGCRIKEGKRGDDFQDCRDPKAWPFPQVMKQVAKERPDVILHLGDYHYRETCTKGKPCEKMSPFVGYGWQPWLKDFFEPAAPTFSLAPWILVRGNHEDCNRAYQGYFHMMATQDLSAHCADYEEPDIIQLKDLTIINLDTSDVSDPVDPSPEKEELWGRRLKAIDSKLASMGVSQNVWMVTHKPFYGLVKLGESMAPVNPNLKKYLDASPLKAKLQVLFAGHVHVSQIIQASQSPLQFVLGNGGTQLDDFGDIAAKTDLAAIGLESVHTATVGFGYAVFSRDPKNKSWTVEFKDPTGHVTSACNLAAGARACVVKPN